MMIEGGHALMSMSGIIDEEIGKQAALANAALQDISGVGPGSSAGQLVPRGVLAMLGPYSAAKFLAERVVQSNTFDVALARALHSKLLPLERTVDDMLIAARQRGYFEDPDAAEPLRWLTICNEQVKDCMVAIESMLDPQLDDLMAAAMDEHQRGETIPLNSIV
jgi:hypothetical protein